MSRDERTRGDTTWNFVVLVLDVPCFFIGLAFLDGATALPALIALLGGGPVAQGAFAAIRQAGFLLPQLLVAHRLEGRSCYKPFLLRVCLVGRVGLFGAAAALLWLGRSAPALALFVLGLAYTLFWIGDGAGTVPWTAIVGRAIPERTRGRFFALTQVLGGLGRIAAASAVTFLLGARGRAAIPFPGNGAILVFACAVLMMASFVFLLLIREPPGAPTQDARPPLRVYLRALPDYLRARPDFGRLALAQTLASAVGAAAPFYLGFARAASGGDLSGVEGRFLIAQTVGGLICAPLWGGITDRRGPRAALVALFLITLLSPLAAGAGGLLFAGDLLAFDIAFFCLGAVLEGGWAIFTNYLLETIPGPEQPTYLGMLSALTAPGLLLPLLAGLLVRAAGAPVALALAALLVLAGLFVARGLPDSRRTKNPP